MRKQDGNQSREIGRSEPVFEHRISRIHSGVYEGSRLFTFMRVAVELPVLIEGCSHTRDVTGAFGRLLHRPKDRGCGWYQMCPKVQSQGASSPRPSRVPVKTRYQKWQTNKARTDVLLQQLWLLPSCWQVSIKNNSSGLALFFFCFSCYTRLCVFLRSHIFTLAAAPSWPQNESMAGVGGC